MGNLTILLQVSYLQKEILNVYPVYTISIHLVWIQLLMRI